MKRWLTRLIKKASENMIDVGTAYANYEATAGLTKSAAGIELDGNGVDYVNAKCPITLQPSTTYTIVFYIIKNVATVTWDDIVRRSGIFVAGVGIPAAGTTGLFACVVTTEASITSPYLWSYIGPDGGATTELDYRVVGVFPGDLSSFDFDTDDYPYGPVLLGVSKLLRKSKRLRKTRFTG